MPLKWGECVSTDPSAHKQKTFETPPKIGMQNPGDSGRTHFSTASVQTSPSNNSKAKNHIGVEMSRNVQSGNTQNLKSPFVNQAACCACTHSRYFAGGSPSGLRV